MHGVSIDRREIQVSYDADEAKLWHALADYSVRRAPDLESDADLAVLSFLDGRHEAAGGAEGEPVRGWLNMLGEDDEVRKRFCSMCGARVTFHCEEPHSRRGPCCQPNESCARCHTPESDKQPSTLDDHLGQLFVARQVIIDMETLEAIDPTVAFIVLDDSTAVQLDTSNAYKWHVPKNEREYLVSPQRSLWRSAKEFKMNDYARVTMFDLVLLESSVDLTVHVIYDTLWAYKIKYKEAGLIFDKLNPRWCVKGGTMDRKKFKSFAEMMRLTSLNMLWAIKSEFYEQLACAILDFKDAFQATGTVDKEGKLLDGETEFYTRQAPGFIKYGSSGEKLVCRQRCHMQGRIDTTKGFDRRIVDLMTKSIHFIPTLWDPKIVIYNNTKLATTAASLPEIIAEACRAVDDSPPQQPPKAQGLRHFGPARGRHGGAHDGFQGARGEPHSQVHAGRGVGTDVVTAPTRAV